MPGAFFQQNGEPHKVNSTRNQGWHCGEIKGNTGEPSPRLSALLFPPRRMEETMSKWYTNILKVDIEVRGLEGERGVLCVTCAAAGGRKQPVFLIACFSSFCHSTSPRRMQRACCGPPGRPSSSES